MPFFTGLQDARRLSSGLNTGLQWVLTLHFLISLFLSGFTLMLPLQDWSPFLAQVQNGKEWIICLFLESSRESLSHHQASRMALHCLGCQEVPPLFDVYEIWHLYGSLHSPLTLNNEYGLRPPASLVCDTRRLWLPGEAPSRKITVQCRMPVALPSTHFLLLRPQLFPFMYILMKPPLDKLPRRFTPPPTWVDTPNGNCSLIDTISMGESQGVPPTCPPRGHNNYHCCCYHHQHYYYYYHFYCYDHYLRKEILFLTEFVCLFFCLFVCQQLYTKCYEWISMTFSVSVRSGTRINWLDFGSYQ